MGTQSLPSYGGGLLPAVSPGGIIADLGPSQVGYLRAQDMTFVAGGERVPPARGGSHAFYCGWQKSSPSVCRLEAPFPMENNIVHCLGLCEGAFHNHFFSSLLSATYMGG